MGLGLKPKLGWAPLVGNWADATFSLCLFRLYLSPTLPDSMASSLHTSLACTLLWRHNGHDGVSNHQPHGCLLSRLFRRRSKKTSKLRVIGLCAGNTPGTGEFPPQMASNAENVPIWWRHHVVNRNKCTICDIHGEGMFANTYIDIVQYNNLLMMTTNAQSLRLHTHFSVEACLFLRIIMPVSWLLISMITDDRWIPRTNGQWRGKCFHLTTSSWWKLQWTSVCYSFMTNP